MFFILSALFRRGRQRGWSTGLKVAAILEALATCYALFVALMVSFDGKSVGDAMWLGIVTVTTVGYGDQYASTAAGRVVTVLTLFLPGIALFSMLFSTGVDHIRDRRAKRNIGRWRWNMSGHIVVVGAPDEGAEDYFVRFLRELRGSVGQEAVPVQILADWPQLPPRLVDAGVVFWQGRADSADDLAAVGATRAKAVVVLSPASDSRGDGGVFNTVSLLREIGASCPIVAECVDDSNRARIRRAGADTVVRPVRAYPAMVVRAVTDPGAESLIEDYFTAGGTEIRCFPVSWAGTWGELVSSLVGSGFGTPIAYRHAERGMVSNPGGGDAVDAAAVYVLCNGGASRTAAELDRCLRGRAAGKESR